MILPSVKGTLWYPAVLDPWPSPCQDSCTIVIWWFLLYCDQSAILTSKTTWNPFFRYCEEKKALMVEKSFTHREGGGRGSLLHFPGQFHSSSKMCYCVFKLLKLACIWGKQWKSSFWKCMQFTLQLMLLLWQTQCAGPMWLELQHNQAGSKRKVQGAAAACQEQGLSFLQIVVEKLGALHQVKSWSRSLYLTA